MNSTLLKSILLVVAAALGGIAVADIDFLNQYDAILTMVAGVLGGWAGLKRPGDDTAKKAPPSPPLGPALILLAALSLVGTQACSQGFSWPKVVESCEPAPADLVTEVTAILIRDGKLNDAALKELEDLGRKHSGAAVLCVINALVDEWTGKVGASPAEESGASKGREFLRRVGAKVEE
jgi:hypothetical protein